MAAGGLMAARRLRQAQPERTLARHPLSLSLSKATHNGTFA